MIIIFHNRESVVKVLDISNNQEMQFNGSKIQNVLYSLVQKNEGRLIGWCLIDFEEGIDYKVWETIFHNDLIMASYSLSNEFPIPSEIGFVEEFTFLNVKFNNTYPTWLMSSDIGALNASVLIQFKKLVSYNLSFDEFLNYVSRQAIVKGLFCYSNPKLFKSDFLKKINHESDFDLFLFVKNHYKLRWLFIMFFNFLIYKKKLRAWSMFKVLIKKSLKKDDIDFSKIEVKSNLLSNDLKEDYDVLIPTLGRAKYLKDMLLDLANQEKLPNKVIIIEQNAMPDSKTELDYIYNLEWPFAIDHTFTHQLGACNARNIALKKISSSWVFFADDDTRVAKELMKNAFKFIEKYGVLAINMASLREGEKLSQTYPIQWHAFSTNSSLVKSSVVDTIEFGMEHEFGFGEDSDFGMKIRNKGTDVIFYPNSDIIHLKAPVGGFRVDLKLPWENDDVQPKPSPTVMAHKLKHLTKEQLLGYKTILFFKYYPLQKTKNPFSYLKKFKKEWKQSVFWANTLIKQHN